MDQPFSTFLFAEPSFLEGMARVLDWSGVLNEYNSVPSGAAADYYALRADWQAVGGSIRQAAETYAHVAPQK